LEGFGGDVVVRHDGPDIIEAAAKMEALCDLLLFEAVVVATAHGTPSLTLLEKLSDLVDGLLHSPNSSVI
jgi:hypothetical protein